MKAVFLNAVDSSAKRGTADNSPANDPTSSSGMGMVPGIAGHPQQSRRDPGESRHLG